ncbi:tRNA pseudouridine synthase Pus10-like [Saccostrea echinata]|uniref:tRNA pseudouridine synthase Pus10-like n=1 Tax=Saccostrea echinata TaxID=191078 RepID=UPI002A82B065|nr:tRNA pseudouridine synthase Pus10-like [Saccostrea echinata]
MSGNGEVVQFKQRLFMHLLNSRVSLTLFSTLLTTSQIRNAPSCLTTVQHYSEKRKNQQKNYGDTYTRTNVAKVLSDITVGYFKRNYSVLKNNENSICKCDEIKCVHDAVFVACRYNKYSRTLSQTPWILDLGRKSQSSVEEEICEPLKQKFRFTEQRFSSSGREDVDVRMLGKGYQQVS